jgi:cell division protease FtsH
MSEPSAQHVINYASPGTSLPPAKSGRRLFGWVLFIGLAVMLFIVLQSNKKASSEIPLSELVTQLNDGNVSVVVVDGDTLRGHLIKPAAIASNVSAVSAFRTELPPTTSQSWAFMQWLMDHRQGAEVRVENNANLLVNLLLPLVPWLLIFAFIWFFVFRQLRNSNRQQAQPKPMPVYIVNPENK